MRELNGLSYDEIGGALGLTNAAARRAVFDARNALHAAADGRATQCVSVRHSISDGDRRSLRARGRRGRQPGGARARAAAARPELADERRRAGFLNFFGYRITSGRFARGRSRTHEKANPSRGGRAKPGASH
jgi:hypothetical protein